jgi:hypothetical protein
MAELEDVEFQVRQLQKRKLAVSPDLRDWIDELTEMANLPASRLPLASQVEEISRSNTPAIITERYLADLGRRLNRARHRNARFADAWARLVHEAADCQAVLNSYASQHLEFRLSPFRNHGFRLPFMTPYVRYHLHVHLLPAIRVMSSGVFAAASFCVVWSELWKSIFPRLSIISYTVIRKHDGTETVNFFGQIMASCWILYMCSAAFAGISDAKVWGNRALVRRNTYPESACWYAGQVAKLTVPLSYNFLTFLPQKVQHNTTFYEFLGRLINLTPLGQGFDYFFPIFILVPVCATLFNLYGRVKSIFDTGLGDEDEDLEGNPSGFGTGGWREGRELIDNELNGPGFFGLSSRGGTGHISAERDLLISDAGSAEPPRQRPSVWVPPVSTSKSRSRSTFPANMSDIAADDADENENVFQSFAHRVKNTFDTASRPKWLQPSEAGLPRPKWMAGDGPGRPSVPDTGSSSGIGSWFSRQFPDARVHL